MREKNPVDPSKKALLPNSCKRHCCQTVAKGTVDKQLQKALLPNSCKRHCCQTVAKGTVAKQFRKKHLGKGFKVLKMWIY
jgi:hypothetical protein